MDVISQLFVCLCTICIIVYLIVTYITSCFDALVFSLFLWHSPQFAQCNNYLHTRYILSLHNYCLHYF